MSTQNDPRQTKHISIEQVIETTCDLAHEHLESYWGRVHPNLEMNVVHTFNESKCISYTNLAQKIFDDIYDEIEGEIVTLMKDNPTLVIEEIEKLYRKRDKNE
tara:strand:- start:235 stop:543 length:309 start_codon:yes stop_codon:yes gene_type:complete